MSISSGNGPAAQNTGEDFVQQYIKMERLKNLEDERNRLTALIEKSTEEGHQPSSEIIELEQVEK